MNRTFEDALIDKYKNTQYQFALIQKEVNNYFKLEMRQLLSYGQLDDAHFLYSRCPDTETQKELKKMMDDFVKENPDGIL